MKKLLSGLLVLSLSVLVGCAAGGPPPAVGVWDAVGESPLGALELVLTFNEDGSGDLSSELLNSPLSGVVYADNTLAVEVPLELGGVEFIIDFNGVVDGDTMTGEIDAEAFKISITATRR